MGDMALYAREDGLLEPRAEKAIKHLLYEIGEHTMEKMVVFDTDIPIALGSDPKTY